MFLLTGCHQRRNGLQAAAVIGREVPFSCCTPLLTCLKMCSTAARSSFDR